MRPLRLKYNISIIPIKRSNPNKNFNLGRILSFQKEVVIGITWLEGFLTKKLKKDLQVYDPEKSKDQVRLSSKDIKTMKSLFIIQISHKMKVP